MGVISHDDLSAGRITFERKSESRNVLKIGIDAGQTMSVLTSHFPGTYFLRVEIKSKQAAQAAIRLSANSAGNWCVICMDALELLERFIPENFLDEIYVFFPTPYEEALSKIGYRRTGRLIEDAFVAQARRTVVPFGSVRLLTDDGSYYADAVDRFARAGWWPTEWRDIGLPNLAGSFVGTPCERVFRGQGRRIYAAQMIKMMGEE